MEVSLKLLRTIRLAFLASVAIYAVVGEGVAGVSRTASGPFYYSTLAVGALMVGMIFVIRRATLARSEASVAAAPDDKAARVSWLFAHIATFGLCEAVALLGLVLRMTGAALGQVAPFYLAGFLLLLYFAPRRPTNTIG